MTSTGIPLPWDLSKPSFAPNRGPGGADLESHPSLPLFGALLRAERVEQLNSETQREWRGFTVGFCPRQTWCVIGAVHRPHSFSQGSAVPHQ